MVDGPQAFERFTEALKRDENLIQLIPFLNMYLVRFPDRNQATILFDALARTWAEARGLALREVEA